MRNMPRVYTSFMPNAPRVNGAVGSLYDTIKKCLNGGWTPFAVSSITVQDGIATLHFDIDRKSLPDYCYLTIAGCSEPLLNGDFCIVKGFEKRGEFSTTVANGQYTGAITAVPTPAGWNQLFTATNTGIFRSNNIDSSQMVVKVTDTKTQTTQFEFAGQALTITSFVEAAIFTPNEKNVFKSPRVGATYFRNWAIVCDNTTVYFCLDSTNDMYTVDPLRENFNGGKWYAFGDYLSNNPFETIPSFYFMSPVGALDTVENASRSGSFTIADTYSNDMTTARTGVRSKNFFFRNWEEASFSANMHIANNAYQRTSGSESRVSASDYTDITSDLIVLPVHYKSSDTSIVKLGTLPGVRYSHYNLRPFMNRFSTFKNEQTSAAYLQVPVGEIGRTDEQHQTSMGVLLFKMNAPWG